MLNIHSPISHSIIQISPPRHCMNLQPNRGLVCLPHAGGNASFFRAWGMKTPPQLGLYAIQYPGREERMGDKCHTSMSQLMHELVPVFLHQFHYMPYVLLGHSMGAAIAFELCHRLEKINMAPVAIILSSHPPLNKIVPSKFHQKTTPELWQEMVRIGGTHIDILHQKELMSILTPPLRFDYQLIEQYKPNLSIKLTTQIIVCGGDNDPDIDIECLQGWQSFSSTPIEVLTYSGGHFYLVGHAQALIEKAEQLLRRNCVPSTKESLP